MSDTLSVVFISDEGAEETFEVRAGMTILDVARQYDINIEGACEGSLVCSTCHVIVENKEWYKKLCALEEITDAEADMLDLATHLTPTSRLGCQIVMRKELDGLRLKLPKGTRNIRITTTSA